jgi:hypothetical protein
VLPFEGIDLHFSPVFVIPAHFTALGLCEKQKVLLFAAFRAHGCPFTVVPVHLAFAVVSGLE